MMIRKCFSIISLFIAVICLCSAASAEAKGDSPLSAEISIPGLGDVNIPLQHTPDGDYLFLPSCADLNALIFRFPESSAVLSSGRGSLEVESGVPFSVDSLFGSGQSACAMTFSCGDNRISFTMIRSTAMRTAFLVSGDIKQGRAYVEADKERKVKGVSFALIRPNGSAVWTGLLKNIKGRGNSTWHYPKKPYQIKLPEEADLLETGDKSEKETTWILLANYIDPSLLRNQITFDLAAEFQLPYTPHSASVDLFYDGEYRGVYLLCEKTEISDGRVAIRNLEKEIENANPQIKDFSDLSGTEYQSESGLTYRCYPELIAPEDIRGGYLLEMDYGPRAIAEPSWFRTESGQYVTVKSPEYVPEAAMAYIASLYQRFERAVFAGGIDPETGEDYRDLCDLDSLARCFLLMELGKNNDAFLSSTYFYQPESAEKLYAGPVWDYDTGYGIAEMPEDISTVNRTVLGNRLLRISSFRESLRKNWIELKPLVCDILLSDSPRTAGSRLHSLMYYDMSTASARRMDWAMWGREAQDYSISELRTFLIHRTSWLEEQLEAWCAGDVPEHLFRDVQEDQWYFDSVAYTVDKGLFTGTSAVQFEPYRLIDRAMAVSVLHRMFGSPETGQRSDYRDVASGDWYASAIDWATESGIAGGIGRYRFAPKLAVTREQMITMLYRAVSYAGFDTENSADLSAYADSDRISLWAREAVAWAVGTGILQGNNGRLEPQGNTTRAQAAAIFARAYQMYFAPENTG